MSSGVRCWWLLVFCIGLGVAGRATPFDADYAPALDDLGWDGGLRWSLPLATVRLEPGVELAIRLEHELVALDYGEAESRIEVRPLETGLYPVNGRRIVWLRPVGGSRLFAQRERLAEVPVPAVAGGATYDEVYQQGGVRLFWSADGGRARIEESGWVLWYEGGGLVGFATPSGKSYEVDCAGRRILCIRAGADVLLATEREEGGAVENLTVNGTKRFRINYSPGGRIAGVTKDGGRPLVAFSYGPEGLLSGIQRSRLPQVGLRWIAIPRAERGDSPYRFPVNLSEVGSRSYRYQIARGVVELEQSGGAAGLRRLRIGLRYGRILWVDDGD